jgi:hypothetical protein
MQERQIESIHLQIEQDPAGQTVHQIWARGGDPSDTLTLLHEFDGQTASGQVLAYTAPPGMPPYRSVRILTTTSPSWVAWQEIRIRTGGVSEVHPGNPAIPLSHELFQNYPNPFNPTTVIGYQLSAGGQVSLAVYDVLGRQVALLVNERKDAGRHDVEWNAAGLPSGVYVARLDAGRFSQTKKIVLLH